MDFDLNLTAFDPVEIDDFLLGGKVDPTEDNIPEPGADTVTRLGDLWISGAHRVLCGDATSEDAVRHLLGAMVPQLMVTDPPYGVALDPQWREDAGLGRQRQTGAIPNDDRVDWSAAYRLFAGDVAYVWHAGIHAAAVAAGLEAAAVVADMVGGLFTDPRTQRANDIANYLGMTQYLKPAQLALTTAVSGSLASENAYGATATGISPSAIRTSPTMLAIESQPPWYALNLSGKPNLTVMPELPSGASNLFGAPIGSGLNQQYTYAQIPGQVLYNQLPADVQQPMQTINLNVNALDSQSILDRSGDIAAAVSKELMMGTGLGQTLANSIFGPG